MKKVYTVTQKEVHYQYVDVVATSPEDAVKRVKNGEGDYGAMEYSHTLEDEYEVAIAEEQGIDEDFYMCRECQMTYTLSELSDDMLCQECQQKED